MSTTIKAKKDGLDVYWDGSDIYRPPNSTTATTPRQDLNTISKPVVLYKNTSTSGANSFTCNLSESYKNFTFIIIVCRYGNNGSNAQDCTGTMIFPTKTLSTNARIHYDIMWGGASNGMGRRVMTVTSDTRFTWGNGGYSNSTNQNYILPVLVLGLR